MHELCEGQWAPMTTRQVCLILVFFGSFLAAQVIVWLLFWFYLFRTGGL